MFDECKAVVLTQRFIYMTWEVRWLSLMEGVGVEGGGASHRFAQTVSNQLTLCRLVCRKFEGFPFFLMCWTLSER